MGDVVRIGSATLYLGDCLDVLPRVGNVDSVVTDPPYGIGWSRGTNSARNSKPHNGIMNDEDTAARDAALSALGDVPGFVFGSFYAPFPERLKQVLVWHKPADSGLVGSVTGFRRDAEPIFMVGPWPVRTVEHSSVLHFRAGQAATTSETGHPHTKPLALMKTLVAKAFGTVVDPFMGSGTTGVACAQMGFRFVGIEIDPTYFKIACDRIAAAAAQPDFFVEGRPEDPMPKQESLL